MKKAEFEEYIFLNLDKFRSSADFLDLNTSYRAKFIANIYKLPGLDKWVATVIALQTYILELREERTLLLDEIERLNGK